MLRVEIYAGDDKWVNARELFPKINRGYFSHTCANEALAFVESMGHEGRIVEVEE